WCEWCQSAQFYQHLDKHVKACKPLHQPLRIPPRSQSSRKAQKSKASNIVSNVIPTVDTILGPERPEIDKGSPQHVSNEVPRSLIKVIHHPHSGKHTPTIIPLDELVENGNIRLQIIPDSSSAKPWAPFRTRFDFEFTEQAVTKCLGKDTIDILLDGYHGRWAKLTTITLQNHRDVYTSLDAARKFGVLFRDGQVEHIFQSRKYTFNFKFRDTWEWILDLVCDPMLSEQIMWYPVQKFLNNGFRITCIYNELNSGEAWWEIQSSLPQEESIPHCFLPLHLWLDKGKVSEKVKMHPIIVRPGFLPSAIRNGSGNGGGVLIGYMTIVGDPNENADNEDDSAASVEVAQFKQEVYHKVLDMIFKCLKSPSRFGEAVRCGDKIIRVLFPDFLIHALDGEEACSTCGACGANANHPCPCCLMEKTSLYQLSIKVIARTQPEMKEVFSKAQTSGSKC
ncbi:hypothetical protein M422DRAFT_157094, partial [Sphaerobolus stellatus SS14]